MRENAPHEAFPLKSHSVGLRVPLFEVDLGGGVYHGNYFHLLELGREAFLKDLGFPYRKLMEREMHLSVVEVTCNYRSPLHYDETVEVRTGVRQVKSRSLIMCQELHRVEEDGSTTLCTRAVFHMVCTRFAGRSTLIPEDLKALLLPWADAAEEGATA